MTQTPPYNQSLISQSKKWGVNFTQRVLKIVAQIPRGKTLTYQEVAALARAPRAWRAVGNVLHQNYNRRIPCHRVIRSDGKAGGYNRGKGRKEMLLKKEREKI